MATHKKTPAFLRVVTNEKSVVCINPLQLSNFQILEKCTVKTKEGQELITSGLRFYFPSGMGLSYNVGLEITQAEFDYVVSTLLEFLYLNEIEFNAKADMIKRAQMEDWNKISQENAAKIPEALTPEA